MSSGAKQMVIQSQERAISPDINRLQLFSAHALAEILRYLTACSTTDDLDAGGNVVEATSGATPLYGKILNGLEVRPQTGAGQLSLQVTDGAALVLVNDSDTDASQYKIVVDPGITSNGLLLMTTNPAGSARIDVIEVQWSSIITATDNRDIFNAATGLFSAANVTKTVRGTLTDLTLPNIRVRAGTAGTGFPANVAGWMPLAVVYNPAGSTQCDDMDFWDVRPIAGDALYGLSDVSADTSDARLLFGSANDVDTVGKTLVTGKVDASVGSRRVGGKIQSSAPGIDSGMALDAQNARDQEAGITLPVSGLWYLYLATPFGLPRWARYTRTFPRVPRSPRGIPIVSVVSPQHITGKPSAAVNLPTSTGLGGSTSSAVCVLASHTDALTVPRGGISDGHVWYTEVSASIAATGSTNDKSGVFTLVDGTTHPANARALYVRIDVTVVMQTGPTATHSSPTLDVGTVATSADASTIAQIVVPTVAISNPSTIATLVTPVTVVLRIPLFSAYPATPGISRTIEWFHNFTTNGALGANSVTPSLHVLGWEL